MKLRDCHFGIMKNTLFEHSNGKFVGVIGTMCSIFEFSPVSDSIHGYLRGERVELLSNGRLSSSNGLSIEVSKIFW